VSVTAGCMLVSGLQNILLLALLTGMPRVVLAASSLLTGHYNAVQATIGAVNQIKNGRHSKSVCYLAADLRIPLCYHWDRIIVYIYVGGGKQRKGHASNDTVVLLG
jgi:hypothetical protein